MSSIGSEPQPSPLLRLLFLDRAPALLGFAGRALPSKYVHFLSHPTRSPVQSRMVLQSDADCPDSSRQCQLPHRLAPSPRVELPPRSETVAIPTVLPPAESCTLPIAYTYSEVSQERSRSRSQDLYAHRGRSDRCMCHRPNIFAGHLRDDVQIESILFASPRSTVESTTGRGETI